MGALDKIIPARFRVAKPGKNAPPPGQLQLVGPVQKRASAVGRLISMLGGVRVPQRSTVKYEINAREGYEKNPVVYRCIRLKQEALKSVKLMVYIGEDEAPETHPLHVLLNGPNPRQSGGDLIDEIVGHLDLGGEAFLEGVKLARTGELYEIYAHRPDRMSPVPGLDGLAEAYLFEAATGQKTFPVPMTGFSPILHIRQWNPRDFWRGLPTVAAAAAPADEYSEAVQQNRALLNNSAQPSGALVFKPKEGQGNLTDEQFERTNAELVENHVGPENAGKPFVLDNFEWIQMGMSPRDAMAVEQRAAAARETALAMGVPPLVLGLPGDNTFANFKEANAAFYRQTVQPLGTFITDKLTRWVRPLYGLNVRIAFDWEDSPLAEEERSLRWERAEKATDLTVDERRALKGYAPLPGGKGEHVLVAGGLSILDDVILGEPDPEEEAALAYGREPADKED